MNPDDSGDPFAPNEDDIPIGISDDDREPYDEMQDHPIAERVAIGLASDRIAAGGIVPFPGKGSGADAVASLPYSERKRHDRLVAAGYTFDAYDYRDCDGRLLMAVVQYRKSGERKEVRPLRYLGKNKATGETRYWWTAIPGTRPLFGLDDLASRPDAPVLFVEGEKSATAARKLFPDHVVMCWPGGATSGAVDKVDVTALAGRTIIGWPDNDDIGRKGMRRLLARALDAGAASAAMVIVPAEFPAKWDLADPVPAGLGEFDRLADLAATARLLRMSEARKILDDPRASAATRRILGLGVGYTRIRPDAVEAALAVIDPDESGLWYRILRCLFYAYGREGIILADEWSRRGQKYKSGEPQRLFDGFAGKPEFTADTLFWLFKVADKAIRTAEEAGSPFNAKLNTDAFRLASVEDLNRDHAVVTRGGKTVVMWEAYDERFDRYSATYLPKPAFIDRIVQKVPHRDTKNGVERKPRALSWFSDGRRRQYDGIVFLPGRQTDKGTLNAWRGFTVEPIDCPAGWDLLMAHLLNNVCQGDLTAFAYIMNWLAACVQWLDSNLGVALVLTGQKGAGKTIVIQFLAHLFGEAAFVTSLAEDVLGKFNARLEHTLLLGLEEAVAANSRSQDGTFKDLITNPTLRVEDKFFSNWTAPNHLRVIMTSNNDFVVRADARERRYAVFEVTNPHQDDPDARRRYFGEMVEQMETGGYAAMLGELLARDITDWNKENIPETEALRMQKMLNLSNDPVAAWWYSRLEEGIFVLSGAAETERYEWKSDDVTWVVVADLVADYQAFARGHGFRGDEQRIKNKLARYMPPGFEGRTRAVEDIGGNRKARMFPIPPLAEAKRLFTEATGYNVSEQSG